MCSMRTCQPATAANEDEKKQNAPETTLIVHLIIDGLFDPFYTLFVVAYGNIVLGEGRTSKKVFV